MSRRPHQESEGPIHGPLQSFDLEAEIVRPRGEKEGREGSQNAIAGIMGQGGLDA